MCCSSADSCILDRWACSSMLVFRWGSLYLGLLGLLGNLDVNYNEYKKQFKSCHSQQMLCRNTNKIYQAEHMRSSSEDQHTTTGSSI
jgi:hypothetical protein